MARKKKPSKGHQPLASARPKKSSTAIPAAQSLKVALRRSLRLTKGFRVLEKFPQEILDMIFREYLKVRLRGPVNKRRQITPPLLIALRGNRILYEGAMKIFHEVNTLNVSASNLESVERRVSDEVLSRVKKVNVDIFTPSNFDPPVQIFSPMWDSVLSKLVNIQELSIKSHNPAIIQGLIEKFLRLSSTIRRIDTSKLLPFAYGLLKTDLAKDRIDALVGQKGKSVLTPGKDRRFLKYPGALNQTVVIFKEIPFVLHSHVWEATPGNFF